MAPGAGEVQPLAPGHQERGCAGGQNGLEPSSFSTVDAIPIAPAQGKSIHPCNDPSLDARHALADTANALRQLAEVLEPASQDHHQAEESHHNGNGTAGGVGPPFYVTRPGRALSTASFVWLWYLVQDTEERATHGGDQRYLRSKPCHYPMLPAWTAFRPGHLSRIGRESGVIAPVSWRRQERFAAFSHHGTAAAGPVVTS
jgi:hypothetical protein